MALAEPGQQPYTVYWPAASGTIKHYKVRHSLERQQWQLEGAAHYYRVRACNDTACGAWSPTLGLWLAIGGGPLEDPDEPENGGEQ